jgi:hypothetical protein
LLLGPGQSIGHEFDKSAITDPRLYCDQLAADLDDAGDDPIYQIGCFLSTARASEMRSALTGLLRLPNKSERFPCSGSG